MLGIFVSLRGRHYEDTRRPDLAEPAYLLARFLFPRSRHLHFAQVMACVQNGMNLFEPEEKGHPVELAAWLQRVADDEPWKRQNKRPPSQEVGNEDAIHAEYTYRESGRQG
jgi:hypothetical protein